MDHRHRMALNEPLRLQRHDVIGVDVVQTRPAGPRLVLPRLPPRHRKGEKAVDVAEEDLGGCDRFSGMRAIHPAEVTTSTDEMSVQNGECAEDFCILTVVHVREHLDDVGQTPVMPRRRNREKGRNRRERIALGETDHNPEISLQLLELRPKSDQLCLRSRRQSHASLPKIHSELS